MAYQQNPSGRDLPIAVTAAEVANVEPGQLRRLRVHDALDILAREEGQPPVVDRSPVQDSITFIVLGKARRRKTGNVWLVLTAQGKLKLDEESILALSDVVMVPSRDNSLETHTG